MKKRVSPQGNCPSLRYQGQEKSSKELSIKNHQSQSPRGPQPSKLHLSLQIPIQQIKI